MIGATVFGGRGASAPAVPDRSWPRRARLRRRAEFTLCYARGRRYHTEHFLLFALPEGGAEAGARFGMAVSRKVGKAVFRNRLKRLLREFFRLHRSQLPARTDVVAVAKKHAGDARLGLERVTAELLPLMRRLAQSVPGRCRPGGV